MESLAAVISIGVGTPSTGFEGNFGELISTLITYAIMFAGIIALFFIVLGGFNYITAGDDAEKAEGARKTITNGVIGLIIVASAFIIFRLIVNIVGLESLLGGI